MSTLFVMQDSDERSGPPARDAQYEGWPARVYLCPDHADRLEEIQGQVVIVEDKARCRLCRQERGHG
jgi:hypothetical protein